MRLSSVLCVVSCICLVGIGLGCGKSDGPELGGVTGTVMMNGEPVPRVNVTFIPKDKGSPSYGGTNEHGEYSLMFDQNRPGAAVGQHDVLIEAPEQQTDDSGRPLNPAPKVKIAKKYQQPGALSADVESGQNVLDFTLDASK